MLYLDSFQFVRAVECDPDRTAHHVPGHCCIPVVSDDCTPLIFNLPRKIQSDSSISCLIYDSVEENVLIPRGISVGHTGKKRIELCSVYNDYADFNASLINIMFESILLQPQKK